MYRFGSRGGRIELHAKTVEEALSVSPKMRIVRRKKLTSRIQLPPVSAQSSSKTKRSTGPVKDNPPKPRTKSESRPVPTTVPTLHGRPPRAACCVDCESTLIEADVFFYRESGKRMFVCMRCRDRRIRQKRSLAKQRA